MEQLRKDKSQYERLQMLGNRNSPLCSVDLNDVISYDEFMRHLTNEEQQRLLNWLPVANTAKVPDSLKSMFNSPQFKENLTYFQQFLTESVFDISLCGGPIRTFYCHYDTFGRNPMKVSIFS